MGDLPPQMPSLTESRSMRTAPLGGVGCTVTTCNFPAPSLTTAYPGVKSAGNNAALGGTFFNNTAISGAGIQISASSFASLNQTMFRQNKADEYGAGLSVSPSGQSELTELTCYENSAGIAGGCVFWWDSKPTDNSWSCSGSTKENRACENCVSKHNTAAYGPDLATDANFMQAVYSRQWGGITPGGVGSSADDVVGKPLGTIDPSRTRRQIYSQSETSLSGVSTVDNSMVVYRPGVRFNMYFLGYDYFGSILKAKQNGNDLLAKVAPCTGPECSPDTRNIGRYMLEFSGVVSKADAPGAAEIVPLIYGGKTENSEGGPMNYSWTLDYSWYRPDLSPGTMKRVQASTTLQAYTQPCAPGERVVYDESPLNIQEAEAIGGTGSWDDAIAECVWCPAGSYSVKRGATTCKTCPTKGAFCTGGGSYIIPKKNYWRGYPGDYIYKCPYKDVCLQGTGVQGTECKYGYEGALCAVCRKGWVSTGKKCVHCGDNQLSADMVALILLGAIAAFIIIKEVCTKWFAAPEMKGAKALKMLMKKKKNLARANAILAQCKILIAYIQVVMAIASVGSVEYPTAFTGFMSMMSFLNLDVIALLKGVCIGPDGGFTFFQILTYNVFFPVAVAIACVFWYMATKPEPADESFEARTHGGVQMTTVLMVIFAVFPNTCKCVINFWRCHEIQVDEFTSKHYLYAAYDQQCYEGDWLAYLPVGILGLFLYPIGTPALFFGLIYWEKLKDNLADEAVVARIGFLYGRFKPEFWWYETSEVIRKMVMGSLVQFVRPNNKGGTPTQILVSAALNIGFLVMFLSCWPFKSIDDNMLMSLSLVAITVTLFCALALNANIGVMDSWGESTTLGVLLGVNGTLIILYAAMMYHFQLPFICNHLVPECVKQSWCNCFSKKKFAGNQMSAEEIAKAEEAREAKEALIVQKAAFREKFAQIEYVPAPLPPPPPLPYVDLGMSDKQLYSELEKYFHRYDLDESGTLNDNEELQQLCTNLCFKLELQLAGEEIDAVVESAGDLDDENSWNVEEFCEWFEERFLGEDASDQSFSAEMMGTISMYQNLEMQEDIMDDMDDDDGGDDDGDDGGDGGD
jgi:hypothetical protein